MLLKGYQNIPSPISCGTRPSGIYFIRAKVGGKLIRKSLQTDVLSVAKLRLADELANERKRDEAVGSAASGRMTLGQALDPRKDGPS